MNWVKICEASVLPQGSGIAAWVNETAVAIFDLGNDGLYAVGNVDPATGVSVLARGLVCDIEGKLCVASPLYKHHYQLEDGVCIEDSNLSAMSFEIKKQHGQVLVKAIA
ncbi:nitrite reductase small subunit NirD [Shewanella intestini]|uniref:Nitrite reductase small subunit NirD n=1 Tax=Shewanella intestini TaxID=2017544 RepID=A0ABS5HZH3_9GAMM|nr:MULTISPECIES: nitrite reductase small subunit NirD [Shewanella]MBR9727185.1 nitrite reductase small subunit NirD [Shewanella intestini]MRG35987.1 nitrite reductase small subunit NirD [Shewanella sp. XMDDZSB0408]